MPMVGSVKSNTSRASEDPVEAHLWSCIRGLERQLSATRVELQEKEAELSDLRAEVLLLHQRLRAGNSDRDVTSWGPKDIFRYFQERIQARGGKALRVDRRELPGIHLQVSRFMAANEWTPADYASYIDACVATDMTMRLGHLYSEPMLRFLQGRRGVRASATAVTAPVAIDWSAVQEGTRAALGVRP